ncbi:centrosomal protein, putative [Eimeria brunetti]|uniref:Centrosomal protein, putative n=1 Tax=Eimeria brunetti TaxID=51314 RepID=U6LMU4_9EIME|nr:centrosomal protein, putative [Eimeria brunetti]
MQNAWCAIRGAVNEINAVGSNSTPKQQLMNSGVLLSEEDDEEEDEEQQATEAEAAGRLPPGRDLPLLLQQQQHQHEAVARQLELSEAETAKYAQQLASLRRECRQLRSRLSTQQQQQQQQQQQPEDTDDAVGAAAAAASSRDSSNPGAAHLDDCSQPLQRLAQALRVQASEPASQPDSQPDSQLASQLAAPGADPWDAFEELCSNLEKTVKQAEFVNVEWEHTKKTAQKLVRCAGALAVAAVGAADSGGAPGFPMGAPGFPMGAPGFPMGAPGAPGSAGSSTVVTPRTTEEGTSSGEGPAAASDVSETERRLRQEVAKRLQLQHQTAALHRRVLELTEDLKDSQQMIEEQREAERERTKAAGNEEIERLKTQLGRVTEQLETVRQLYKELLASYEKRQNSKLQDASEELTGENKDLLLQLRSWQASHAAVSHALQEALSELADLRGDAARVHALERELETVKRESGRLEEIREIQSLSEVELIKAHSERDEMEKELQETKMAVEKYARVLKRVQTDHDATVNRLRSELAATQSEMQMMRNDIGANETLKTQFQDLEKRLAEAEQERDLARATAKKYEEDNKTISEGMQKLLQKLHAQVDDQDYFVDKRIIAQMIAKHQEMHGNMKRRDEIFLLICDVLGFSDEERERYGLPRKQSERGREGGSLSEQFVEFLNGEVS